MTDSIKKHFEDRDYDGSDFAAGGVSSWFGENISTKNLVLSIVLILSATVFFWLVDYVRSGAAPAFEHAIPLFLHEYASPLFDQFAQAVSIMVTVISLAVLGYLLYRRMWRQAGFWLASTAGAAILGSFAKRAVHRHRPVLWDLVAPQVSFGFPSGHATQSMAIVIALFILFYSARTRTMLCALGSAFIVLVAVCRMYLGLHYPSDIVGGWVLSATWVCLLGILFSHSDKTPKHRLAD
jgi:undecaprenyl-diphosphatase